MVSGWLLLMAALLLLQPGAPQLLFIGAGILVEALGIGVLILPIVGAWAMAATLRAGLAHQRLARLAAADGMELDVTDLPRRPSGRIERDAADALFTTTRAELDADPDNWVRWYRLARAYDYAGDRGRAREAMRTAVAMQATEAHS